MSNPAALKAAIDSGGKTLFDGYQNFLRDAAERRPIPSQVDFGSFKVGENLAVTPGDVVMRRATSLYASARCSHPLVIVGFAAATSSPPTPSATSEP